MTLTDEINALIPLRDELDGYANTINDADTEIRKTENEIERMVSLVCRNLTAKDIKLETEIDDLRVIKLNKSGLGTLGKYGTYCTYNWFRGTLQVLSNRGIVNRISELIPKPGNREDFIALTDIMCSYKERETISKTTNIKPQEIFKQFRELQESNYLETEPMKEITIHSSSPFSVSSISLTDSDFFILLQYNYKEIKELYLELIKELDSNKKIQETVLDNLKEKLGHIELVKAL